MIGQFKGLSQDGGVERAGLLGFGRVATGRPSRRKQHQLPTWDWKEGKMSTMGRVSSEQVSEGLIWGQKLNCLQGWCETVGSGGDYGWWLALCGS